MKIRTLFATLILVCLISSCTTGKQTVLPYFNDIKDIETGTLQTLPYLAKIQPSDELQITVTSTIPAATSAFNLPEVNPATTSTLTNGSNPRSLSYIVDSQGNINFPVLGTLHVAGMTVEELQQMLTQRISQSVVDPQVTVRLTDFTVGIGGEVKQPQIINVANGNRITILEALAQAGDLTEYGERSNILVIREENGVRSYHHLNLNEVAVLNSPYYYLQPNDYVYVAPNKIRQENSKYNQNNGFKLSIISTVVSAASVIASLVIALTVK